MNEVKNVRAVWKGVLSFGLVSFAVKCMAAVRDWTSPLHQYHKDSLMPIRYKKFEGDTSKEIKPEDIARGFEMDTESGKKVVVLTDEELNNLNIDSEKVIDITDFVLESEIDRRLLEKPYFLVPDKGAIKGYSLLFNVLKNSGRVGIAKVALRGREYLMAVGANSVFNLLTLEVLRWNYEVINPIHPAYATAEAKVSTEELKLATMLVDAKTTTFDPAKYKDNYNAGLMALIKEKSETGKVTKKTARVRNVKEAPDMVAILNASLAGTTKKKSKVKV